MDTKKTWPGLSVFEQHLVEHSEKYEGLPLNQIPNFYLNRPLTEYEMKVLQCIAACETSSLEQYEHRMSSMVLTGHIDNLLKVAYEADKLGYWHHTKSAPHRLGLPIESTFEETMIPFRISPKTKEY